MFKQSIKPVYIITGIVIIFLGVVIALVASQIWKSSNPITIDKVPSDARLFINNKEVGGSRTNLANGTYTIRAEKEGFVTRNDTIVINDNNKIIVVSLTAESDEANRWAEANKNEYLKQEARAGARYGEAGQKAVNQNPIIADLPINNYTYSVGTTVDQSDKSGKSIIVTVDADEGYRNAAVRSIIEIGYDPGDYTIRFENYTNPFTPAQGAAQ